VGRLPPGGSPLQVKGESGKKIRLGSALTGGKRETVKALKGGQSRLSGLENAETQYVETPIGADVST